MKKEHIVDIIYSHVKNCEAKASRLPFATKPIKRVFLSDWEIKKLYDKGKKEVKVPVNAIISPLSLDWLEYNNIKVIRIP
ncbi:MAG: hypothetical protein Fur0012_09710 [Elusimicrobiota bacterium]